MISQEKFCVDEGTHVLNPGRAITTLVVKNTSDRPIQVGSHYHFAETNAGLEFDRGAAPRQTPEHWQRHGRAL